MDEHKSAQDCLDNLSAFIQLLQAENQRFAEQLAESERLRAVAVERADVVEEHLYKSWKALNAVFEDHYNGPGMRITDHTMNLVDDALYEIQALTASEYSEGREG